MLGFGDSAMEMQFLPSLYSMGKISSEIRNCGHVTRNFCRWQSTLCSRRTGAVELQDCTDCVAFLLEQKCHWLSVCTFHLCIVFSVFCAFRECYALQTAGLVFSVE